MANSIINHQRLILNAFAFNTQYKKSDAALFSFIHFHSELSYAQLKPKKKKSLFFFYHYSTTETQTKLIHLIVNFGICLHVVLNLDNIYNDLV